MAHTEKTIASQTLFEGRIIEVRKDKVELENGSYVYFVHSFMAKPSDENDLAAVTDYGTRVPAMVARGNLFGCQFHPEKSGEVGLQMLRNFAKLTEVGK